MRPKGQKTRKGLFIRDSPVTHLCRLDYGGVLPHPHASSEQHEIINTTRRHGGTHPNAPSSDVEMVDATTNQYVPTQPHVIVAESNPHILHLQYANLFKHYEELERKIQTLIQQNYGLQSTIDEMKSLMTDRAHEVKEQQQETNELVKKVHELVLELKGRGDVDDGAYSPDVEGVLAEIEQEEEVIAKDQVRNTSHGEIMDAINEMKQQLRDKHESELEQIEMLHKILNNPGTGKYNEGDGIKQIVQSIKKKVEECCDGMKHRKDESDDESISVGSQDDVENESDVKKPQDSKKPGNHGENTPDVPVAENEPDAPVAEKVDLHGEFNDVMKDVYDTLNLATHGNYETQVAEKLSRDFQLQDIEYYTGEQLHDKLRTLIIYMENTPNIKQIHVLKNIATNLAGFVFSSIQLADEDIDTVEDLKCEMEELNRHLNEVVSFSHMICSTLTVMMKNFKQCLERCSDNEMQLKSMKDLLADQEMEFNAYKQLHPGTSSGDGDIKSAESVALKERLKARLQEIEKFKKQLVEKDAEKQKLEQQFSDAKTELEQQYQKRLSNEKEQLQQQIADEKQQLEQQFSNEKAALEQQYQKRLSDEKEQLKQDYDSRLTESKQTSDNYRKEWMQKSQEIESLKGGITSQFDNIEEFQQTFQKNIGEHNMVKVYQRMCGRLRRLLYQYMMFYAIHNETVQNVTYFLESCVDPHGHPKSEEFQQELRLLRVRVRSNTSHVTTMAENIELNKRMDEFCTAEDAFGIKEREGRLENYMTMTPSQVNEFMTMLKSVESLSVMEDMATTLRNIRTGHQGHTSGALEQYVSTVASKLSLATGLTTPYIGGLTPGAQRIAYAKVFYDTNANNAYLKKMYMGSNGTPIQPVSTIPGQNEPDANGNLRLSVCDSYMVYLLQHAGYTARAALSSLTNNPTERNALVSAETSLRKILRDSLLNNFSDGNDTLQFADPKIKKYFESPGHLAPHVFGLIHGYTILVNGLFDTASTGVETGLQTGNVNHLLRHIGISLKTIPELTELAMNDFKAAFNYYLGIIRDYNALLNQVYSSNFLKNLHESLSMSIKHIDEYQHSQNNELKLQEVKSILQTFYETAGHEINKMKSLRVNQSQANQVAEYVKSFKDIVTDLPHRITLPHVTEGNGVDQMHAEQSDSDSPRVYDNVKNSALNGLDEVIRGIFENENTAPQLHSSTCQGQRRHIINMIRQIYP